MESSRIQLYYCRRTYISHDILYSTVRTGRYIDLTFQTLLFNPLSDCGSGECSSCARQETGREIYIFFLKTVHYCNHILYVPTIRNSQLFSTINSFVFVGCDYIIIVTPILFNRVCRAGTRSAIIHVLAIF